MISYSIFIGKMVLSYCKDLYCIKCEKFKKCVVIVIMRNAGNIIVKDSIERRSYVAVS